MIKILFISDTVGHDGLNLCADFVPLLKRDLKIDFCIVNGENSDDGKGITKKQASKLKSAGVDVITSGNHIWQKSGLDVLSEPALNTLRPANYPEENPGRGFIIVSNSGCELVVINLQGRSFLPPIDCPFKKAMEIISAVKKNNPVIFVDFHAEASAEKLAMGWYLDGKVSAVIGTHTHVQTADERIFPKGTAYITDAGMTGSFNSVIGMDTDTAIKRFTTQLPKYFKVATGNLRLNGVVVSINETSGKAVEIKRLNFSREEYGTK